MCTKFHHQPFLESGCLDNLTAALSPIFCWNPLPSILSIFCGPLNLQHFCDHWDLDLSFKLWLVPKSRYNVYGDIHIRFRSRRPASHLWLRMIECHVISCLLMVLDSSLNWDCRFGWMGALVIQNLDEFWMMGKLRKFIPKKGIWPEISVWRCLLIHPS